MKLVYILILLILLAIAGLYVWNIILQTKRIPIYRNDEVRLYPVVEYPIDEYPYYYGWWWPWYGGSYDIVGSRYGNYPYPLPYYGHGGGYSGHSGYGGHRGDGHRGPVGGGHMGPGGGGHMGQSGAVGGSGHGGGGHH